LKRALALALSLLFAAALLSAGAASGESSRSPSAVSLSVIPGTLPADGGTYPALVVSLVDSAGAPTFSLSGVQVFLSTTNASIATVPTEVTVPAGHAFLQVGVTTSGSAGVAVIGAASPGVASSTATVTTARPSSAPVSFALDLAPARTVVPLAGEEEAFAVQLLNSRGGPALASRATSVVITASNGTLLPGTVNSTIPAGGDVVYGGIGATPSGSAVLTALSPQLGTGTADLVVLPASKSVTVSFGSPTVANGGEDTVLVTVQVLGEGVPGVNVSLYATAGALVPAFGYTASDGVFTSRYLTGGAGPVTVNATVYSPLLGVLSAAQTLVVLSASSSTQQAQGGSYLAGVYFYVPVVVAAVVVVAGYAFVRATLRRRRGTKEEEYPAP
jgi:hypothetical protein